MRDFCHSVKHGFSAVSLIGRFDVRNTNQDDDIGKDQTPLETFSPGVDVGRSFPHRRNSFNSSMEPAKRRRKCFQTVAAASRNALAQKMRELIF